MARLGELRTLVAFQTSRGFRLTEPEPVLYVIANALHALTELEPYRLNASWLRRFLPPGYRVEQAVLDEVVLTASRSWLTADKAGRLVGLDLATFKAILEQGTLLARLNPFDETAEQRTARRTERNKAGNRRRQAKFRERVRELNGTCAITSQNNFLERYSRNVPNAIVSALRSGATTVAEIAAVLGKSEATTRKAVTRTAAEGLITRTGRGRYAPPPTDIASAGGGLPPLPACDREEQP